MRAVGISSLILVPALMLSACGGGGGGSATAGGQTGSTGSGTTATWTVEPVFGPWITTATLVKPGTPTAFPVASGTTPTTPPVGTVFPLDQIGVDVDSRAPGVTPNGGNSGAQLTYRGTNASSVPLFELTIPDFNLDFTGLPGDGTTTNTANGSTVKLSVASLNYSLYAAWAISPFLANAPMANELGVGVSGYQTPTGGVPGSGSATYLGKNAAGAEGGVAGIVIVSNTSSISVGAVTGQASMTVNFGAQSITGTLSNMTVTNAADGSTAPWNDVSLTGTLSGTSVSGATGTPAASSGNFGFSASSNGKFGGALFGPNGEEVGVAWTLNDPVPTFGKSAFGYAGATKQ